MVFPYISLRYSFYRWVPPLYLHSRYIWNVWWLYQEENAKRLCRVGTWHRRAMLWQWMVRWASPWERFQELWNPTQGRESYRNLHARYIHPRSLTYLLKSGGWKSTFLAFQNKQSEFPWWKMVIYSGRIRKNMTKQTNTSMANHPRYKPECVPN